MKGILKGFSSDFPHVPVSTMGSCGSCFIISCVDPGREFQNVIEQTLRGISNSGDFLLFLFLYPRVSYQSICMWKTLHTEPPLLIIKSMLELRGLS